MELSLALAGQILGMVLMALVGFLLARAGVIKAEDSRALSKLLVYVFGPGTLIYAFQREQSAEVLSELLLALAGAVLVHGLFLLLARLFSWGKAALSAEETAMTVYSNCGNLIIPMVQGVLGQSYVLYTSPYLVVQNLLLWTHGKAKMGGGWDLSPRRLATNPGLMGVAVGLTLFLLKIQLPSPVSATIAAFSACLNPTAMIVIGILLAGMKPQEVFLRRRVYWVSLLRLVVFPGAAVALLVGLRLIFPMTDGRNILLVVLLAAAGPGASMVLQLGQIFQNPKCGEISAFNVVTTLLCIVTMPLLVLCYQMVG